MQNIINKSASVSSSPSSSQNISSSYVDDSITISEKQIPSDLYKNSNKTTTSSNMTSDFFTNVTIGGGTNYASEHDISQIIDL